MQGEAGQRRGGGRERAGLVVAARSGAERMEADRNQAIDADAAGEIARDPCRDQCAELAGETGLVPVLQAVDRVPERPLVRAGRDERERAEPPGDRGGGVAAADAEPASRSAAAGAARGQEDVEGVASAHLRR